MKCLRLPRHGSPSPSRQHTDSSRCTPGCVVGWQEGAEHAAECRWGELLSFGDPEIERRKETGRRGAGRARSGEVSVTPGYLNYLPPGLHCAPFQELCCTGVSLLVLHRLMAPWSKLQEPPSPSHPLWYIPTPIFTTPSHHLSDLYYPQQYHLPPRGWAPVALQLL